MARITSLAEAISTAVRDGDTVALEGFTHLIPHAACHEIIRQGRRNLTLIRMTPDLVYDQMIGMGCVSKLVFSWGGNPGVGSLHRFRDAVENGWPHKLELEEHSHAAMANAYEAGAAGLPCAIFRGYIGGDLPKVNAKIKRVTCPFTGEELAAIPAHRPDVAVIHAQRADKAGNVMIEGVLGVQKEAVLASKRSVVTVEEIVDELPERSPQRRGTAVLDHRSILPPCRAARSRPMRRAITRATIASTSSGTRSPRDRDSFAAWMKTNVLDKGPDAFRPICPQAPRSGEMTIMADYKPDRNDDRRAPPVRSRTTTSALSALGSLRRPAISRGLTHAPDITLIYESGTLATKPTVLPLSIGDGGLSRNRADHRLGAGNVSLLAAGRPHQGRLSRRCADRQVCQPQYDRGRLLRQAESAAAGRRRGAGNRHILRRDLHHRGAGQTLASSTSSISSPPSATSPAASRAPSWASRPKGPTKLITDLAI